jgi:hypothetical protein
MTVAEAEHAFEGQGYAQLKQGVGESVADCLMPIQDEFKRILNDKAYIDGILHKSSEQASYLAEKTLEKVKRKSDFTNVNAASDGKIEELLFEKICLCSRLACAIIMLKSTGL